ncbi:hypothetical protein BH23ACT11_BH23ACT11_23670 [soil metagenome]
MASEETTVLKPSRARTFALLAGSGVLTAASVYITLSGETPAWFGWFVASFFGLCTLVFLVLLLPGSAYLKVTPEGFTICSLFRSSTYSWMAVESFKAGEIGLNNNGVVFDFSREYEGQELGRDIASSLAGHEGALPDTYGMSPEDLAEFLNRCRRRYTAT